MVYGDQIGKKIKEIEIQPLEVPARDPAPEPEPVREPVREPVKV